MTETKLARKSAHEALIDWIEHLVEMGGLAEPQKTGRIQYRERYALPGLLDRINSVVIPNDKGQAREIADKIYLLVMTLANRAISDDVAERLKDAAGGMVTDYIDVQSDDEPDEPEHGASVRPHSSAASLGMSNI